MSVWWIGSVLAIAAILGIVGKRRGLRSRPGARMAEELFEGLLPSAMTGGPREERAPDGWGLRWTDDVTNLTAKDHAVPPARRRYGRAAGTPVHAGAHEAPRSVAPEDAASPPAIDS